MYCVYKHKRIIIITEVLWNSKELFWRSKLKEAVSIVPTYSKKYQAPRTQPPCCAGYTDFTARELEGFVPFVFTNLKKLHNTGIQSYRRNTTSEFSMPYISVAYPNNV
jgi:hypothetical protein